MQKSRARQQPPSTKLNCKSTITIISIMKTNMSNITCRYRPEFFMLLILVLGVEPAFGRQDLPKELTPGLEAIDQNTVTSTVTFLSSDEMRGRDTPSPELTVASSYVAARFRGAGLQGLGDDGSFYQVTEVATVEVPQDGIVFERDGATVKHFGMLSADAEPFSYRGTLTLVNDESSADAKYEGPVCLVAASFDSRRAQSNFRRQLVRLRQNGATAILVQVDADHPLVGQAAAAGQPRMVRGRGGAAGAVALVAKCEIDGNFKLQLPSQSSGKATVRNVMGIIPGSDPALANEAIIFSAHLDHIGEQGTSEDTICNGADDNATGVTGVLSLADAYAALPTAPKRTVIFMTFWGEEKGLLGSRYYVNHPVWPLEKTVANINLEMLGRPEQGAAGKCWSTGWEESDLSEIMSDGAKDVDVLIFQHPEFSGGMLYRASDNAPFVDKGVIAHSFSAGSLHQDYHKVSDEWEKLELRHMTKVIQGLFAGSFPIANGEATPTKRGAAKED